MKASQMGVVLRGDRNQCANCDSLFNSTHAFEKHRMTVAGRRVCLSSEEMRDRGMVLGADGFWRGSAMPSHLLEGKE